MIDKIRSLSKSVIAQEHAEFTVNNAKRKHNGITGRYEYTRAINRARKYYSSQINQQSQLQNRSRSDTGTSDITKKAQCVIQRAWYDLEGYDHTGTSSARIFSSAWDNLFSKIRYLKTLSVCIEFETSFSSAYWELNRRLLIARVERDDRALLDVMNAASQLKDSQPVRFFETGQALIDALRCESMLHLFDLIEGCSTNETRIGFALPDLANMIIDHYPSLLFFFNQSFETTRNEDDQNFPIYSLPLARIIKLIDDRFRTVCSGHRQHYLQQVQFLNRGSAMPLSTIERTAAVDVLSRYSVKAPSDVIYQSGATK